MAVMNQENNRRENKASSHQNNADLTGDKRKTTPIMLVGERKPFKRPLLKARRYIRAILGIYYIGSPPGEFPSATDIKVV